MSDWLYDHIRDLWLGRFDNFAGRTWEDTVCMPCRKCGGNMDATLLSSEGEEIERYCSRCGLRPKDDPPVQVHYTKIYTPIDTK